MQMQNFATILNYCNSQLFHLKHPEYILYIKMGNITGLCKLYKTSTSVKIYKTEITYLKCIYNCPK